MRIIDLLFEGNLKKSDFYVKSRLDNFIRKLESGDTFQVNNEKIVITPSKEELKNLKSFRDTAYTNDDTIRKEITKSLPSLIGGIRLTSIFKSEEFGGKSSAESANVGPSIEALKSIAIYAQLINRGQDPVSIKDIVILAQEIKKNAVLGKSSEKTKTETYTSTIEKEVPDNSGNVNDHFVLRIMNLNRGPFLRAVNLSPSDSDLLTRLSGILKYVNTESDLRKYSKFFASNNKRDPVKIECVGGAGGKTDVQTTYLNNDKDNIKNPRILTHLSMSIKADNSQIEQAAGTDETGIEKFFKTLGLDKSDAADAIGLSGYQGKIKRKSATPKEHQNRVNACVELLKIAGNKLQEKLSRIDDKGEAKFIHGFLGSLTTAMTGNENLVYVNFDAKGNYYKLNPTLIKNLSEYVDLKSEITTTAKGVSRLYIIDKNTNKSLFHVRLMVSKKERIAYFFELDSLLDLVKEATSNANKANQSPTPPQDKAQDTPAGIQNQNKTIGNKIPMGQEPNI